MMGSLPVVVLLAASAPCRAASPVLKIVTIDTERLQRFRRMHAMATNPDLNGNPDFFANLAAAPGRGDVSRKDITGRPHGCHQQQPQRLQREIPD